MASALMFPTDGCNTVLLQSSVTTVGLIVVLSEDDYKYRSKNNFQIEIR